jgi:hypothetical protein
MNKLDLDVATVTTDFSHEVRLFRIVELLPISVLAHPNGTR